MVFNVINDNNKSWSELWINSSLTEGTTKCLSILSTYWSLLHSLVVVKLLTSIILSLIFFKNLN